MIHFVGMEFIENTLSSFVCASPNGCDTTFHMEQMPRHGHLVYCPQCGKSNRITNERLKACCKYPDCEYYNKNAMNYCSNSCVDDHHDYVKRLRFKNKEEKKMPKDKRKVQPKIPTISIGEERQFEEKVMGQFPPQVLLQLEAYQEPDAEEDQFDLDKTIKKEVSQLRQISENDDSRNYVATYQLIRVEEAARKSVIDIKKTLFDISKSE